MLFDNWFDKVEKALSHLRNLGRAKAFVLLVDESSSGMAFQQTYDKNIRKILQLMGENPNTVVQVFGFSNTVRPMTSRWWPAGQVIPDRHRPLGGTDFGIAFKTATEALRKAPFLRLFDAPGAVVQRPQRIMVLTDGMPTQLDWRQHVPVGIPVDVFLILDGVPEAEKTMRDFAHSTGGEFGTIDPFLY